MLFDIASTTSLPFLPYLLLSVLTMAEGPLATLLGRAASSAGLLLPIPAYFSVVIGNLISDMGWYGLGRFGKLEWLKRFGSKVGLKGRPDRSITGQSPEICPTFALSFKTNSGISHPHPGCHGA